MLTIRRILFPTDFSDGAARAFPQAATLAEQHGAELHVLNVSDPESKTETALPVPIETLNEWFGTPVQEKAPDVSALTVVQNQVEGDAPPEHIAGYIDEKKIDLVVMGTHGRRGVQRMLLGSVTEEVVRKASCPVLTVRTDAEGKPGWGVRRILVPVDFSDAAHMAVRHANELAQTYGAELELLHVIENVSYPSAYGVEPAPLSSQEVLTRVESHLGEIAREDIGREHVHISTSVGHAPSSILDHIDKNDIDLVVIATHGRTGLDRILLGSVAERVLRRSSAPVFLVKPNQKSLLPVASGETTEDA